jgi:ribosomal-protein-alanine N-acetyltransferase
MDEANARAILEWHYDPPYDSYDPGGDDVEEAVRSFLDPKNAYYRIVEDGGDMVAYCCFGPDARVPGGDYSAAALDIGLGVRPDQTGRRRGHVFVEAVLAFAQGTFVAPRYRVTVARFNQRAQRVWERAGFSPVHSFRRSDGMPFVILEL